MDKDKRYIPPRTGKAVGGSGYGRKVSSGSYDIDRARDERMTKLSSQKRKRAEQRAVNVKKRKKLRIRVLLVAAVLVLISIIILFFTPLLNIERVSVAGNSIVKSEELLSALEGVHGQNLILMSDRKAMELLGDISYVESATVSKYLIPPSVKVTIKECMPAATVEANGVPLIIDPQLKILSDGSEFSSESLPRVEGLSLNKYRVGRKLALSADEEKLDILELCLGTMIKLDMIDKIDFIDLTNTTNIRFGYDERLDALCGTHIDLERKIRMFNAVVNGTSIAPNARGTIDLSVSGKAKYEP